MAARENRAGLGWCQLAFRKHGEVGASDTSVVGEMNDNGAVAKECADARLQRGEQVIVGGDIVGGIGVTELAAQVTNLACRRRGRVAWNLLATLVGVEMSKSLGAVAIGRDRLVMKMIQEWAALGRETIQVDGKVDTLSVDVRSGCYGAANRGLFTVGKSSDVAGANWVVQDGSSVTELSSCLGRSYASNGEREKSRRTHGVCICFFACGCWESQTRLQRAEMLAACSEGSVRESMMWCQEEMECRVTGGGWAIYMRAMCRTKKQVMQG